MERKVISLSPVGFNELKMCRSGPMVYNKYDVFVGGSLRAFGEFSVAEHEAFTPFLRSGDIVVEVGANIGAHTVDLSQIVGERGRVYAFEPQRIVFQTLCANLALNQCVNVFAYQAGVGAEVGTINVPELDPANVTNFGGVTLIGAPKGETIPLVTIDSLALPACRMIKIDVEGMELFVLKGAVETIASYRPTMYVENDREENSRDLLEFLFGLDYDLYWHLAALFRPNNFAGAKEDIFNNVASINVLCVPREVKAEIIGLNAVKDANDWWRPRKD
jgi:FkbM family methyltransferase